MQTHAPLVADDPMERSERSGAALLHRLAGLAAAPPRSGDGAAQTAVDLIAHGLGVSVAAFLTVGAPDQPMAIVAWGGDGAGPDARTPLARIAAACLAARPPVPLVAADPGSDPAFAREGIPGAFVAAPVALLDGTTTGVLCALADRPRAFLPEQIDAIAVAATLLGGLLSRVRDAPPAATADDATARLREERDLLRAIVDASDDVVFAKDGAGRYRWLNRAAARSFGLASPEAGVGRTAEEIFAEIDARVLATGEAAPNGLVFAEETGEPVWYLVSRSPLRDAAGQIVGIVGISRDITALKRAEAELAAERDLLQSLLDTIPDPVFVKDRAGAIVRMNRAFAEENEIADPLAVVGQTADTFLSADFVAEHAQAESVILETGEPVLNALERYEEDGRVWWYLMSKAPWRSAAGEIVGLVGTYRDITPLREAEADLRAERDVLDTLLNALPDAVFVKDRDGRFVRVNAAAAALYGVADPAAVVGKTDLDVFPGEQGRVLFETEQRMMATGEPSLGVLEQHGDDPDTATWRLASKVPLRDERGRVAGLVGISRDVTELHRAERALRAERDLLQTIIDATPDFIHLKAADGTYQRMNAAWVTALGLPSAAAGVGRRAADFFSPERAAVLEAEDAQVVHTGEPVRNVLARAEMAPEERRVLRSKWPVRDAIGHIVGVVGVTRDVTERKHMEDALAAERDLLQTILDALPDNVYLKDAQGRYLRINRAAARYLGLADPAVAVGRTADELWPPEWAAEFRREDVAVLTDVTRLTRQIESRAADGTVRHYLYSKVPVLDGAGQPTATVTISTDVTVLKQAERRLAEALAKEQATSAELEQLSHAKSEFLSMLTHEFRTPLTAIQGYADLIHAFDLSPAEARAYAGEIVSSAQRLTRLTNDLLELDRMQARRLVLTLAPTDLGALVREVVNLLRSSAAGHTFLLALDQTVPPVVADADRLAQVVTNLVGNAIKYAPDGGTVTVRTRREGGDVLLSVSDEGIGIPAELLERVFEPYVRTAEAGRKGIAGTGLGLPIARELVILHGGHIWAESTPGEGATFTVRLPIAGPDGGDRG